ncbi:fructose-bisphosphatase class III [Muricomes sp. OA1]|uniref:Fructose-1,6-bisphosphatase class 3 n=1 Tax=Hungatella hathewayi TaxID=154046 RepID=A0A3E2WQU4_9FIRM|nr:MULTISPECIES: fructose-bisphosphatase class III [Clostridia]MCH1973564.1 fructose-bisphosphatase class III [Muricomes sp. OA1]RGC29682.1 fructose-bisphosphatase class III [Hungatella hathewayi]GKH32326.1 fructose-1,6-bisphosphatase class 3 [Faecalicatena contorta]
MKDLETRYLERLSDLYPTIAAASTEIINLQAILNLPKGTEHFLTDIHGEYEAFAHVLKNGSGSVRRKIDDVFGNTLSSRDKQSLATLIYYPKDKMAQVKKVESNMEDWYKINLYRLIEVSKRAASKYTRSKVRKALPKDFAYVIEELITEKVEVNDKESYYNEIIKTIIRIGRAEEFIAAISELIQRLVVDHLHIVGDIYDRGPGPHIIMDKLMTYHSLDIQWGNHDVLWMGAAAGQRGCMANVVRICARYGNLDILEDGYGINLLPLATFALRTYGDDPCTCFALKGPEKANKAEMEMDLRMHKAISIIQFKVEGQIIKRHKDFGLDDRALLHKIDFEKGTVNLDGTDYPLLDTNFPTIDPKDPYKLSEEEKEIMERMERAFLGCEKLQEHMRFLLAKGSLYKVYNHNLLYHGCVPLNEDGSLKEVCLFGRKFKGKSLYDALDRYLRKGFFALNEREREDGKDMMWYIWLNPNSPLFGKNKMATFERYFLAEKETHVEKKNPYYYLLEKEEVIDNIMREFGLCPDEAHVVNGHVPVKCKNGESPIKCNGKVLVIDGGFSKAYQKETGIAGYTLIYNSYGLLLVAHEPFESTEAAIQKESDIHSDYMVVKRVLERRLVGDTDIGKELKEQVADLERLLAAYRSGEIIEKI